MRLLIAFRAIHKNFRIAELRSTLCLIRSCEDDELGDLQFISAHDQLTENIPPPNDPLHLQIQGRAAAGVILHGEIFAFVELRNEQEALLVAQRCVLIRAILVPVGHGRNMSDCIASVTEESFIQSCAPLFEAPFPSYRVVVESFGRSLKPEQQIQRVHDISVFHARFPGPVRLRGADQELWVIEDSFPVSGHAVKPRNPAPRQVLLARLIARGDTGKGAAFSLKQRIFIGPTSMDAELAFIMANFARVTRYSFVLDPFAGTGGVLVACAARGAHTIAADINLLSLRGKEAAERIGILDNFTQYSLQSPLGVLRMDALHSAFRLHANGLLDALVCDPPYGIKEGAKMFREGTTFDADASESHFPSTQRVRFDDLLCEMLEMAVDLLVEGGRLVFWLPTTPDYRDEDLPTHPLLSVLHNCEQPLTMRLSRRLIVMVRKHGSKSVGVNRSEPSIHARPAHFDLAARLLFQPERDEGKLQYVRRPVPKNSKHASTIDKFTTSNDATR